MVNTIYCVKFKLSEGEDWENERYLHCKLRPTLLLKLNTKNTVSLYIYGIFTVDIIWVIYKPYCFLRRVYDILSIWDLEFIAIFGICRSLDNSYLSEAFERAFFKKLWCNIPWYTAFTALRLTSGSYTFYIKIVLNCSFKKTTTRWTHLIIILSSRKRIQYISVFKNQFTQWDDNNKLQFYTSVLMMR